MIFTAHFQQSSKSNTFMLLCSFKGMSLCKYFKSIIITGRYNVSYLLYSIAPWH